MKKDYVKIIGSLILTFSCLLSFSQIISTGDSVQQTVNGPVCEMPATYDVNDFKNIRSEFVKARMENQSMAPCSEIIVGYTGFTNEARIAFQFAVDIWANLIESPVPIRISANFADSTPQNLGSASPAFYREVPGAPTNSFAPVLYPAALFEKLTGQDSNGPNGQSIDINCNFNRIRTDWYFGTDANPPNDEFDFVTVVLHELGHGLGVAGFGTELNNGQKAIRRDLSGFSISANSMHVSVWDTFIDGIEQNFFGIITRLPIIDESEFPDPSTQAQPELEFQLEGDNLTINAPTAVSSNDDNDPMTDNQPKTFAPPTFNGGSSYSHLDEATFNNTPHALMTPFSGQGEANHDPGNIILGFMRDMGWEICNRPSLPLSTNEFALEDVTISPNPFINAVTVNLPLRLANEEFSITIVDINGRIVNKVNVSQNNGEIVISNLENLANSLYFLTIKSNNSDATFTKKIIKQ